MNAITKTLLSSVALCALAAVPAAAGSHPAFSFTALHGGHAVNKTKLHNHGATHITYTFGVYSYISFSSAFGKKVPLAGSFYKWNSYSTFCSSPKQKIKVIPKKTEYAKIGITTQTYSLGCPSGPTVFYGVTYKIYNPDAEGHTDHFVVEDRGRFKNANGKYRGLLNMDYTVFIE